MTSSHTNTIRQLINSADKLIALYKTGPANLIENPYSIGDMIGLVEDLKNDFIKKESILLSNNNHVGLLDLVNQANIEINMIEDQFKEILKDSQ